MDRPSPLLVQTTKEIAGEPISCREPISCGAELEIREHLAGQRAMLIDVYGLLYRVFYASGSITCPAGREIGATFGFLSRLLDLLESQQPDYVLAVFDAGSRNFRHHLYPEYKAQRQPMPVALKQQLPVLEAALDAFGIGDVRAPGFEADDVAATVAKQVEAAGGDCLIVSNDKDFRQLVSERVRLVKMPNHDVVDAEAVKEMWGVRPDQCVDFQALVGDAVDNVPGIRLIGPKLAAELLQRFGTLDAVLDNAGAVSGPRRQANLRAGRAQAFLSRQLVRLRTDVPCDVPWRQAKVGTACPQVMDEVLEEMGFIHMKPRALRLLAQREITS